MRKIAVNGVSLAYEILGKKGVPIALTPAGVCATKQRTRLHAERLAVLGYKAPIWDRRNCGDSGLRIEGNRSELEIAADDLHALLNELGMTPVYAGGGSGGYLTSLLFTHS